MNIQEALQVLENAAASDVDDVKEIFSSEYKNLRKAMVKHTPHALLDKLNEARDFSIDYTVEKAKTIDKSVYGNPWYYIGGAALSAGLIGFIVGRSNK
jgi:ElaB/YqjD/DUF883 family membrane-anchored ribosome-binding protein